MKQFYLTFLAVFSLTYALSQHLYAKKLNNCNTDLFCLDCGDQKANVDNQAFNRLIDELNKTCQLNGVKGRIIFQILLDSTGAGCVLSHTDVSNSSISKKIVKGLNAFDGYIPAKTGDNIEGRTSFDIVFAISDNRMTAQIQRVDIPAFEKSFDQANNPEIYNKTYVYSNNNLSNYNFTVLKTSNSTLQNNWCKNIAIDSAGIVWMTTEGGVCWYDGDNFHDETANIPTKSDKLRAYEVAVDNLNNVWVNCLDVLYSYNGKAWTFHDPKIIGIDPGYWMSNNSETGEIFFGSDHGLAIYKDGLWSILNKEKIKEFPSDRVTFAKRDSKNRIWIGTFGGSLMIDEQGTAVSFNETETVLKNKCITAMAEDEVGNLYFTLFEYDPKVPGLVNKNEGIAIRTSDGNMKQLTTTNSGIPINHANDILYEKNEKVLWISTERAGLVRYDLKGNWENYHNLNSKIPTSFISSMAMDQEGAIYLATRQGLVRIDRNKE